VNTEEETTDWLQASLQVHLQKVKGNLQTYRLRPHLSPGENYGITTHGGILRTGT